MNDAKKNKAYRETCKLAYILNICGDYYIKVNLRFIELFHKMVYDFRRYSDIRSDVR